MQWDRNTPWRQGSVLPAEVCVALGLQHHNPDARTIAIIASHDCDLAQDPIREPHIEIMVGQVVDKIDGNCSHAKNPRILHLELAGICPLIAEFVATEKHYVKKENLTAQFEPDPTFQLSPESHQTFQFWLASRYRRSAFPDEFDRRLTRETGLAEKIAKIIKKYGEHLTGIFFDVDEGVDIIRSGADDTYLLRIFLLHSPDLVVAESDQDFQKKEKAASQAANEITSACKEKLFSPKKQWQHIELEKCFVLSEELLTYQQFKQLKRWRFEHISLAQIPQQEVLAE